MDESSPQEQHPDASDALEDALAQIEAITAVARASEDQARHQIQLRETADQLREAAERNCDDLRTALRMLEAGPRPTPEKRPNIFQRLRERGEAAAEAPGAVVYDADEAAMIRNARTCER
jgi:hypothetical protein